jgi:hypothetical protein
MSRVDEVLAEMPAKEAQMVYIDRAKKLETQLSGEEIITLTRSGFPFGTMVVTDRRLIVLLQDGGGVQVIKFSDISSLDMIKGGRGMMGLGARRPPTLVVQYRNGKDSDAISIGRDGDWGEEAAETIIEQHQAFAVRES